MILSKTFLFELVLVGLLNLIFGFLISYVFMGQQKASTFDHWKSLLLSFFITGMVIHLFCELTGMNDTYCNYKTLSH